MNKINKINIIYLLTVLISVLGSFITTYLYAVTDNMIYTLLASQILLILPALYYIISNKFNLRKTIRFKKVKTSNIFLIILFSYMIIPLMSLINLVSMLFVKNDIQNTVQLIIEQNPLYLSLLTIALIPCLFEESVYRGIFYNEYRKVNVTKGILLSAFLFALLHMNFNQFFYAFVMGVIFVLLIEATDSIVSSMIMHFIINGSSVFNAFMLPRLQDILSEIDPTYANDLAESMNVNFTRTELLVTISSYAPMALITTIIAVFVFIVIAKNSNRFDHIKQVFKGDYKEPITESQTEDSNFSESEILLEENEIEKRMISIPLYFGIIICIVLMVINEFV